MNSCRFLKSMFEGYCRSYQMNCWHTSATYTDMTQDELHYFTTLGKLLGYNARREYNKMDLSWYEFDKNGKVGDKLILYLERENNSARAVTDATNKLLKNINSAEYLVGTFGWITSNDLSSSIQLIDKSAKENGNILVIAFVGPTPDTAIDVLGIIWTGGKQCYRKAKAALNNGGYWYIFFEDNLGWQSGLPQL